MTAKKIITIDFETEPIEKRPDYPPAPVGVAIKVGRRKGLYRSWGHPSENNCASPGFGAHRWIINPNEAGELLFHNAGFDVDVLETMERCEVDWSLVHDTMWTLFLLDPRAQTYALKPSSERYLGEPPAERDAVIGWLVKHQPIEGVRLNDKPKGKNYAGKWICKAPGDLVGKYAIGDVDRTYALHTKLYPKIKTLGMLGAYERERRLAPHLLEMERSGLHVDHDRLRKDEKRISGALGRVDNWVRKVLDSPTLNVDSNKDLVSRLVEGSLADPELLSVTEKTGGLQSNKAAIDRGVTDPSMRSMLRYRSQIAGALRVFLRPWLEAADKSGGLIYTKWHSTRSDRGGASSGRLSSTPNFQNLSNAYPDVWGDVKKPIRLAAPPLIRSYIVPPPGYVLIDRDYSQQEIRAQAHFENDKLLAAYQKDPWMDAHDFAGALIREKTGLELGRKKVKTLGFGMIYGMGLGKLAESLSIPVDEARTLKKAYLAAFPGIGDLYDIMRQRAKDDKPIRTWGGRLYYCEEPEIKNGKIWQKDYKLVNVLIQGSGADCTKEALARFCESKEPHWYVLLTAHDEILCAVPREDRDRAMAMLREAMESIEFDVPMLSEGKWSDKNWASMKPYDEKGIVYAKKTKA